MISSGHFWRVLWRFIKPEIEETIVYVGCIASFVALAFYQTIVSGADETTQDVSAAFSVIKEHFAFITDGDDTAAKIFTFGTWFIIGTVVYILAWFLISFSTGAFHDIEVSKDYVHPRSFKKSNYWVTIGGRTILRVAAALSLVIYISIWLATLAPAWLASYKEIFLSGISKDATVNILIALVGTALSLHVGAILLRVVLLRSKYFYGR
jgi:hypothetical protein